ncbi:hypothetical protein JCM5350_002275 [Sporobolomyces pararoseus]
MDSPYSPLEQTRNTSPSSRSPSLAHRQRHGRGGGGSRSPPLVPMPPAATSHHSQEPLEGPPPLDPYDPNYHHQQHDRHSTDPYYRNYRDHYSTSSGYREESWRHHHHQQPYEGDRFYQQTAYPPPPAPPIGYDPFYQHSRYHHDPYAYSRDPYSRADYYSNSSHSRGGDPYYSSRGGVPPPAPPPSYPPHYPPPPPTQSSVPPVSAPPPPPTSIPTFPTGSTAVSLGPHPIHGHLDPSSDLSIPILYLARPISTKTFCPLRSRFKDRLELRFVNSLLDLERDLSIVKSQDLAAAKEKTSTSSSTSESGRGGDGGGGEEEKRKRRRRIWISAVGGTDSLVQKIWNQTTEKIEWKEIVDLPHLQLELMWEDQRVGELWKEEEEEEERIRREQEGEEEGLVKEEQVDERSKDWEEGKREIEQRELEQGKNLVLPPGKVEELDRVLRAVRGEGEDHQFGTSRGKDEFEVEPDRLGTSRNGERGEAVVDRFENMVKREHVDDHYSLSQDRNGSYEDQYRRGAVEEDASYSRKRSRHEESEEGQDHTAIRAARKKLEAICKAPRRNCVQWAEANRVPVNDETRMVDQEPVLGERHRGVWDLFGQELDDISPQIQVLMARAMRDVTYPPRLRLYSTPEAQEQLEEAVPWFTTLLKTIGDRYELAGAASVVPQDPPVSENPLDSQANSAAPA